MTDPISDFLTRIRNASQGPARRVRPRRTRISARAIAAILKTEGYIADYQQAADASGHKTLVVKLKYVDGAPAITGLTRVSTPGRRLYYGYTEIPRVLNGLGISIVSTSKGLMKDADCRRQRAGGELICNVW